MLRDYRRVRDSERIAFQLAFQAHLFSGGFPTAPVVRTDEDEAFVLVDGLYWALFDLVDGQEFDFTNLAQAREAGRRLAQFKTVAAAYTGPVVAPPVTAAKITISLSRCMRSSERERDCRTPKRESPAEPQSRPRRASKLSYPRLRSDSIPVLWVPIAFSPLVGRACGTDLASQLAGPVGR